MRCRHCRAELAEGELICPVCGTEVQIVPDYNPLDDVLENQVRGAIYETLSLDEETQKMIQRSAQRTPQRQAQMQNAGRTSASRQNTGRTGAQRQNTGRTSVQRQNTGRTAAQRERVRTSTGRTMGDDRERERMRRRRQAEKKRMLAKKRRQRMMITGAVVVILAIVIGILGYQNSYAGQVKKGYKLLEQMEYDNAIVRFKKAIDKNEEKADAYTGLASVYIAKNDLENAEQVFLSAIKDQPENADIYEALVEFYLETNQNTKISYLIDECNVESVVNALAAYASPEPKFGLDEEKVYDDIQALELTSEGKAIYYTLDGSDPTISSKKYTDPIKLEEGETTVKAISVNEDGIPSIIVTKTYTIEFPIADAPSVTPSTGQYDSQQSIEVVVPDNYEAYYTLDGTDPVPGESGTKQYTKAVKMPEGNTIFKVVLADANGRLSDITIRNYDLTIDEE